MKKFALFIITALLVTEISCGNRVKKEGESIVIINTNFGEIKVKLYDETPDHKKNFLKMVNEGFYNDLLFHRVIKNFMIQGGDPESKNAEAGSRLGGGSPGYTVPAEILPKFFHKKGALAAARTPDSSNPEKRSSGSQFYIVHGELLSLGKLDTLETMKNSRAKNELLKEYFAKANNELSEFRNNQDQEGFNLRVADLREEVDSIFATRPQFKFSDEQKEAYTTIGGYPSLDGDYTVFGEVIEGFDVIDKIAAEEVDKNNRPVNNVIMKVELVK